jgi:hypothetical protein
MYYMEANYKFHNLLVNIFTLNRNNDTLYIYHLQY